MEWSWLYEDWKICITPEVRFAINAKRMNQPEQYQGVRDINMLIMPMLASSSPSVETH